MERPVEYSAIAGGTGRRSRARRLAERLPSRAPSDPGLGSPRPTLGTSAFETGIGNARQRLGTPPATATSACPDRIASAAVAIASFEDAQARDTVLASVLEERAPPGARPHAPGSERQGPARRSRARRGPRIAADTSARRTSSASTVRARASEDCPDEEARRRGRRACGIRRRRRCAVPAGRAPWDPESTSAKPRQATARSRRAPRSRPKVPRACRLCDPCGSVSGLGVSAQRFASQANSKETVS